jgi:hypothetical protein
LYRKRLLQIRMPSNMQGYKHFVYEGGVRNFLAVRGPGVQAGAIDSTLLDVTDLLPTLADLAGATPPSDPVAAWDGMSFKNLLTPDAATVAALPLRRGTALASPAQLERAVVSLASACWDADAVPELDPVTCVRCWLVLNPIACQGLGGCPQQAQASTTSSSPGPQSWALVILLITIAHPHLSPTPHHRRQALHPQPLFDYDSGGKAHSVYSMFAPGINITNPGFQACLAVRYKQWKWIGLTGKVYRCVGSLHYLQGSRQLQECIACPQIKWVWH